MKRKYDSNKEFNKRLYLCSFNKRTVNYQLCKPFKKIILSYTKHVKNEFVRYPDDGIV